MNVVEQSKGRYFRKESLFVVACCLIAASVYVYWPATVVIVAGIGVYLDATRPDYPTLES